VASKISSSQFLLWDPLHISVTNGTRKLKFGTLVVIYVYHSARYKYLSATGRPGNSLHISETNRGRKFKIWYAGRHLQVLWLCVKMCPLGASEEISSSQFLFWDPLRISVTNGARNLKFGTLVGIYAY